MDENRKKALAAALGQIEKQFGKGAVMRMGDASAVSEVGAISSGSLALDVALGIGGLPRGRVVEIYGPESSGKTTLMLHIVANAQKMGGLAAFIDAEHALDPAYAKKLGVPFIFLANGEKLVGRAIKGLSALTRLTKAFGDVLSYLRLFALGLASASLAVAFNDMAAGVREAMPGIGLLFALLILVLGHALNFVLAIASGVIHGLRLNFIEFFDWGVKEEGHLFRAFRRKGSE